MSAPTVVPAATGDSGAIVALWRDCGLVRPWNDPEEDLSRAIGGPASDVLVARDRDALVGTVMVGHDGHRGWVYYLAVAPGARRSGIGRALMAAAEAWLRERRIPKIQLMVRDDNAAALAFYAALGLERQAVTTLGRFLE